MPPATLQVRVPIFTPAGAALAPAPIIKPAAATAAPSIKRKVFMVFSSGNIRDSAFRRSPPKTWRVGPRFPGKEGTGGVSRTYLAAGAASCAKLGALIQARRSIWSVFPHDQHSSRRQGHPRSLDL